ncbi:MAG: hypothetical protein GC181_16000 [Bacteroidetes bacterium]|nr:hypothetical protein [Bacteroidota bacterium]
MHSNPLESYFRYKSDRSINGDTLPWTSTDCSRGYLATWKLVNDSLFLTHIQRSCDYHNRTYFEMFLRFFTPTCVSLPF